MSSTLRAGLILCLLLSSGACRKNAVTPVPGAAAPPLGSVPMPPPPLLATASIQELMDSVIDPASDALWNSVSVTQTRTGTVFRQPQGDEQWHEVRRRAIALVEGANLLVMDGRKLVAPGSAMLDEGTSGVLGAEEGQKRFDAQHPTFVQFTLALRSAGMQMLTAIDKRDAKGMMNAGAAMEGVCENCHLTFWYPDQVIPPLPLDFGRSKSAPKPKRIPLSP